MDIREFISLYADTDVISLALQRHRFPDLGNASWRFALQQIDGRQRVRHKLPELYRTDGILYPPRLNLEQCSSEATALYKAALLTRSGAKTAADLTGGFGIDSIFFSRKAQKMYYVERNTELAQTAEHNFRLLGCKIETHNTTAEDFMQSVVLPYDDTLLYLDPARRSAKGTKVFLPQDCEPDFVALMPLLQNKARHILLKLSPMLDLSSAAKAAGGAAETHIVAVGGEVKEVLLLISPAADSGTTTAVDLKDNMVFRFNTADEQKADAVYADRLRTYLYEPHASILKAGAFKTISVRYGVSQLDPNTHFYTSDRLISDFPGRIFKVTDDKAAKKEVYNVVVRNYPLKREELIKSLKIKDGDGRYLLAFRLNGKPQTVVVDRL